ncbi:MAG: hypothetical protein Q9198_001074 [Flavoplaca austrocitrina]
MPRLSQLAPACELTPVTTSLRFVGDLRDQAWTCHFLTSVARDDGFRGLLEDFTNGESEETETDFHQEKMAQRKILEMAYTHRMLIEMAQSCEGILGAFQKELKTLEARDPFTHNKSWLYSKTGEVLRDILKLLNSSARTLEDWEKREDSRVIRSRWSQKDETRFGPKLEYLTRKCKLGIQQVRFQRDLLEEQQRLAEQRHRNMIDYMSLQTALKSSQSAEDVRLFTYVTILFLPLSFSSSLFSMEGTPERSTISVMIPTTLIALAVTIFALTNMKALNRNLSFRTYKLNAKTREMMRESGALWGIPWENISRELEEAAELRLAKQENEKHLTAQSRWWYIVFWILYTLESFRIYMLEGFRNSYTKHVSSFVRVLLSIWLVPACALILIVQILMLSATDLLSLLWQVLRWVKGRMMGDFHPTFGEVHERFPHDGEKPREVGCKNTSTKSVVSRTLEILLEWLQAPPRPLQRVINTLRPSLSALDNVEPQMSESDMKVDPLIQSDGMHGDGDDWEMNPESYLVSKGETLRPEAQPENLADRRTSDGSFNERPAWWTRLKSRKTPESRVSSVCLTVTSLVRPHFVSGAPSDTRPQPRSINPANLNTVASTPSDLNIEVPIPYLPEACFVNIIAALRHAASGDFAGSNQVIREGAALVAIASALVEATPPPFRTWIYITWIGYMQNNEQCASVVTLLRWRQRQPRPCSTNEDLIDVLTKATDHFAQDDVYRQMEMNFSGAEVVFAQAVSLHESNRAFLELFGISGTEYELDIPDSRDLRT